MLYSTTFHFNILLNFVFIYNRDGYICTYIDDAKKMNKCVSNKEKKREQKATCKIIDNSILSDKNENLKESDMLKICGKIFTNQSNLMVH